MAAIMDAARHSSQAHYLEIREKVGRLWERSYRSSHLMSSHISGLSAFFALSAMETFRGLKIIASSLYVPRLSH